MPVYRAMTPAQRVAAGLSATDVIRDRLHATIRESHPEWTEAAVAEAVSSRMLGARIWAWCSPPEELIVKKLSLYQQGASDKHLRDIAPMLRISPEQINLERIRSLAADHELGALLDRVLAAADDD